MEKEGFFTSRSVFRRRKYFFLTPLMIYFLPVLHFQTGEISEAHDMPSARPPIYIPPELLAKYKPETAAQTRRRNLAATFVVCGVALASLVAPLVSTSGTRQKAKPAGSAKLISLERNPIHASFLKRQPVVESSWGREVDRQNGPSVLYDSDPYRAITEAARNEEAFGEAKAFFQKAKGDGLLLTLYNIQRLGGENKNIDERVAKNLVLIKRESGGDPLAKNQESSAEGLVQFTTAGFLQAASQYGRRYLREVNSGRLIVTKKDREWHRNFAETFSFVEIEAGRPFFSQPDKEDQFYSARKCGVLVAYFRKLMDEDSQRTIDEELNRLPSTDPMVVSRSKHGNEFLIYLTHLFGEQGFKNLASSKRDAPMKRVFSEEKLNKNRINPHVVVASYICNLAEEYGRQVKANQAYLENHRPPFTPKKKQGVHFTHPK